MKQFIVLMLCLFCVGCGEKKGELTPAEYEVFKSIGVKKDVNLSEKERTIKTCEDDTCWRVVSNEGEFKAQNRIYGNNEWEDLCYEEFKTFKEAQDLIDYTRAEVLKEINKKWELATTTDGSIGETNNKIEDVELKLGQVWEYRCDDPFSEINGQKYLILDLKDGYVEFQHENYTGLSSSCESWFKIGKHLVSETLEGFNFPKKREPIHIDFAGTNLINQLYTCEPETVTYNYGR